MPDYANMTAEELQAVRNQEIARIRLIEKLEAVRKYKHRFSSSKYEIMEKEALQKLEDFNKKFPSST